MSEFEHTQLEEDLAAMTQFTGETPGLWRKALQTSHAPLSIRQWLDRLSPSKWQWIQVAALLIVGCGVLWMALGQSLSRARSAAPSTSYLARQDDLRYQSPGDPGPPQAGRPLLGDIPILGSTFGKSVRSRFADIESSGGSGLTFGREADGGVSYGSDDPASGADQRRVVRKASVELRTSDVRAAFVKVQMLVSEAGGEYIENSAISGEGEQMQADLTLRVSAARVSEVLNALRDIGNVLSQQLSGEDVTAQVVDLDARLSNERRVEAELLELLDTRKDAELKDVLELRRNIGEVREQIERLQGQQQHLARLVSLATVLVIIRHDGQPKAAPEQPGIGAYFVDVMKSAWENGVTGLADSIAWIAATLLGGLIWWTIAAIALWTAWRRFVVVRATPAPPQGEA